MRGSIIVFSPKYLENDSFKTLKKFSYFERNLHRLNVYAPPTPQFIC